MLTSNFPQKAMAAVAEPLEASKRWWTMPLGWVFVLVCSIPLLSYGYLIHTVGANNISNDYLRFINVIDQVLSGTYNWRHVFSDTFLGQHCNIAPILLDLACAKFLGWNARLALYIGIGIAFARMLVLFAILSEPKDGPYKYLLLGGLLALVFSISQASVFFFGASFAIGLCLLGFAIGLAGIAKLAGQPLGLCLMLVGGFLSCSSWGNVLPCWLGFLVALWLFKWKGKVAYIVWLIGALVSLAPYFYIFAIQSHYSMGAMPLSSLGKWPLMLNILGRPFCNKIGLCFDPLRSSFIAGVLGMVLMSLSILTLLAQGNFGTRVRASLVMAIYSLAGIALVGALRTLIAPWYTALAISFWIALWSLTVALLKGSNKQTSFHFPNHLISQFATLLQRAAPLIGTINVVVLTILYLKTNHTYEDKHFYLSSRAPVSESTIRNFRTAPTYCEGFVFQWGDGHYRYLKKLAEPLERHGISAFSAEQQWALQGDFPLKSVRLSEINHTLRCFWLDSMALNSVDSWRSYKHLNLCLPSPNQIKWTINLPCNLEKADLVTAFGIASTAQTYAWQKDNTRNETEFEIIANIEDKPVGESSKLILAKAKLDQPGKWQPIMISLLRFKGHRLSLILTSYSSVKRPLSFPLFEYPHIDVKLSRKVKDLYPRPSSHPDYEKDLDFGGRNVPDEVPDRLDPAVKPSNTELSAEATKETPQDYCFPSLVSNFWKQADVKIPELAPQGAGQKMVAVNWPTVQSCKDLSIRLHDYSDIKVELATALPRYQSRSLVVGLELKNGSPLLFSIPLLPDNTVHQYSYDFKLLDLDQDAILSQISLSPTNKSGQPLSSTICVRSIRLIHKSNTLAQSLDQEQL